MRRKRFIMKAGRLLVVILILVGIVLALIRLRELDVPFTDVLLDGVTFALTLALLFLILIGAGKIIGWLFGDKSKDR